ncbi:MAG: FkbM family methyltransferase [Burkholderiales bacterium]
MTEQLDPSRAGGSYRSQNGEDRWLDAHFGYKRGGFFVEVGAYDGVNLSNTYHFEQNGWTGILVEPDPDMAERCRRERPRSRTFECAVGGPGSDGEITFFQVTGGEAYSTTSLTDAHRERVTRLGLSWREVRVAVRTLDSILEEALASRIDFVSIDVEGGETAVLRGFDIRRWKPGVVIVETNTRTRDSAVRRYFVANRYAYHHSIDVNDFYLPVDAGTAVASVLDGARYLRHRAERRIARSRELALRAWRKHVVGRLTRPQR